MRRVIPIVVILACIIAGIILTESKTSPIPVPDEIILHNGDVTLIMEKSDATEQVKAFNRFTKLVNGRITKDISTAQDIINNEQIDRMKNNPLWIEFRYKEKKQMNIKGNGFKPFEYTNLFFLLESSPDKNRNTFAVDTMQHGEKSVYEDSSRGPLTYSKELVDYAKTFKPAKKDAVKQ